MNSAKNASCGEEASHAASDSEISCLSRNDLLAKQVRGPSSDELERECQKENWDQFHSTFAHDSVADNVPKVLSEEDAKHVTTTDKQVSAEHEDSGWTDITGTNQLFRKIIKLPTGNGNRPQLNQKVTIRMEGSLVDDPGKKVDCHNKISVLIGFSDIIDALDMTIRMMAPGEIDHIKTDSRFAYGTLGREDLGIPPNAVLTYEVELLSVEDGPLFSAIPFDDLIHFLNERKKRGKYYFERNEYGKAVEIYGRAAEIAATIRSEDNESEQQQLATYRSILHSNRSTAFAKLEDWKAVISETEKCLKLTTNNAKALFRRGNAFAALFDLDQALHCLNKARFIDPHSLHIERELDRVEMLKKKRDQKERLVFSRMLQGAADPAQSRRPITLATISHFIADKFLFIISFVIVLIFSILLFYYYKPVDH